MSFGTYVKYSEAPTTSAKALTLINIECTDHTRPGYPVAARLRGGRAPSHSEFTAAEIDQIASALSPEVRTSLNVGKVLSRGSGIDAYYMTVNAKALTKAVGVPGTPDDWEVGGGL